MHSISLIHIKSTNVFKGYPQMSFYLKGEIQCEATKRLFIKVERCDWSYQGLEITLWCVAGRAR